MEWKEDKLDSLLEALIDYRGKTPKKTTSGIPLITAKIVKGGYIETANEFIAEEDYDKWMVRGLPKVGDVVLTTEAPLGEVAQIKDEHVALAQRIVTLRGKESILDNTYLKYYFLSAKGHARLEARQSGTTVVGIKQSELRKVEIRYPDYPTQRRIASILSSLDRKIELNNKINAELEEMAQAIFKSWFVDFDPFKDGEFIDSELGRIPKGWRVCRADEIYKINIGKTPPRKEHEWFSKDSNDNIWVSISDMGSCGMFISNSSEYLTHDAVAKHNILMVEKNTILLSFKLTVGRVAIADEQLTTNEAIARFCLPDQSHREYLYLQLKNYDYNSLGSTSSIATAVNSKTIKGMKLLYPSYDALIEFSDKLKTIFERIRTLSKESSHLSQLRDTLLPKLMNGEINLDELEDYPWQTTINSKKTPTSRR